MYAHVKVLENSMFYIQQVSIGPCLHRTSCRVILGIFSTEVDVIEQPSMI